MYKSTKLLSSQQKKRKIHYRRLARAHPTEPSYSSELSVSSCFSTLVWDVSRISPARNISSTTV